MDLGWTFSSIFLRTLFLATIHIVQGSSTNSVLLNDLKHFNMNRHHLINPSGKQLAQGYISDTLTSLGLHTWTEQFKAPGKLQIGTNIVGVLPGRQYKKKYDRLILIGAHYDTVRTTNGADDNGSGVVAMLQVARILTKASSRCTRQYSVMFVAFDFEEWESSALPGWACDKLGCGSRAFVANFSQYWNLTPHMSIALYGQLQGAIIMDTIMNYDPSPNSQIVPLELKSIFPKQYNSITANQNRGDFLIATGRSTDDIQLLNTFDCYYGRELGNKYKLQVFPLPFDGPESKLSEKNKSGIRPFLRSDHVSFWNELTSNRAIFLSDTANMRSYMKKCYHKACDTLRHLTNDILGFLSKSCDTIVKTTNYLTMTNCRANPPQTEDVTPAVAGVIGMASTMFVAVNAFTLWVCCGKRKQDDQANVLVENDQLEGGMTDVTPHSETREDQPSEA